MVIFISLSGKDFGPMKKAEAQALAEGNKEEEEAASDDGRPKGRVIDLVLPIAVLIVCAILGMAYVGGFFGLVVVMYIYTIHMVRKAAKNDSYFVTSAGAGDISYYLFNDKR